MIERLSHEERESLLSTLTGWELVREGEAIRRNFLFRDFSAAFAFMTQVAILAEKADHHPEWSNVYNRLEVVLTTHDVGGLSTRDIALARSINALLDDTQQQGSST